MTEWHLAEGDVIPRPDPGITDVKADVIEPIELIIRTRPGARTP
jgi:hypothetical protein